MTVGILDNPAEMDAQRELIMRHLFGKRTGYVCIAYGTPSKKDKEFREEYVKYPEDIDKINSLVNRVVHTHNVWFCPMLLDKRSRKKENVSITPGAWSDLDTCEPERLHIDPSIVIESSPGRFQAIWKFEKTVPPDDAENISQRIAYEHADEGADRSGWDLTQLLRMPYTYNYKYASEPLITVVEANTKVYRPADFDESYPQIATYGYLDIPEPQEGELEVLGDIDELIQRNRMKMNPMIWRLYQETPDADWSASIWKLNMMLFEAGFERNEVFAIATHSACNKYARDGRDPKMLWKEVCRAEAKHLSNEHSLTKNYSADVPMITDEERASLEVEDTFIERYITWAKSLGDAAQQYHQAGAFTALSALLAGNVRLPTSFGTLIPNLWFMILADTTLTRKSTAMDIAMDLVMEIDPDVVLATDGSIEGLLTALSMRPGQPGVFLRDEFSGLLEQMTKKDYMAGMPELLTKLYDGKMQKRILRKETIEVKDPILLLFAGGIKDKITSLLTYEQVSSGFMPRFVFITAESDITKVKPLGPPTDFTDNNRQAIYDELADMANHYKKTRKMVVTGSKIEIETAMHYPAKLTPEAWFRYNTLETMMLDIGMDTQRPDIMTPVYDRLCKSILKAAVLLAASEQRTDEIIVEEKHLVRAIGYGENWRTYANEIMNNVGKGQEERRLDNIYNAICREPGIFRSQLMTAYHLSAREASPIFETLEQRNLVSRRKHGRGEQFFPVNPNIKTARLHFTEQEKAV
jgi:hypothetical protein